MLIPFTELFPKYNIKCTGILQCGANTCQEAEMYNQLQIPEVLWVEAIDSVFRKGKEHIAKYPNQTIIRACLSDKSGEIVTFHVSNNEAQSSSFLELGEHLRLHPEVHYVEDIEMETITVDALFNLLERNIKHINFLNLDLQGSELLCLKGATKLLKQIDYIYTEVNKIEVYKNCALVTELDEFLSDFTRVETGTWVGEGWTDALYIRKTLL